MVLTAAVDGKIQNADISWHWKMNPLPHPFLLPEILWKISLSKILKNFNRSIQETVGCAYVPENLAKI